MSDVHAARRARVRAALGSDALVLPAAPELHAGRDGELRYLPDPDLYYLTGYTEPDAVLVLSPAAPEPYTLFVRPRDEERELWTGVRGGVAAARDVFGADGTHAITELAALLPKLVEPAGTIHAPLESGRPLFDAALRRTLADAQRTRPRTGRGPFAVADPAVLLGPMRLRKDAHELTLMRAAARITVHAFESAARRIPGAEGEWQVEAALEHAFRLAGAGAAFPSIAAAGANATVLHYRSNDAPLRAGELLLLDGGARHQMYCADVSRTFPASGRFTAEQRAVYDVVLAAHAAACAAVAPRCTAADMHAAATRTLVEGMIELGLVRGTPEAVLESGDHRRYFPHRTSHWIGLDVHDVGDYALADGSPVALEPGMVLTVEPGLYVPADDSSAPAALRGVGIRLEDDLLVTDSGHELLTAGLAIMPGDVEALLAG
jgi:Xaa-Pro aminopeptidase